MDYVEAQHGEYGILFTFTIYDATRTIYDLTGLTTVALRIAEPGEEGSSIGTGSVSDAEGGEVEVSISSTDVTSLAEGRHEAQIQVSGGATKLITKPFEIRIGKGI